MDNFHFLAIMNNAAMNIHVQVYLWTYISVTRWTCWIILCLTFWRTAKLFPTMAALLHIPTSSIWASQILYIITFFKL